MNDKPGPTLTKIRDIMARRIQTLRRSGMPAMNAPGPADYRWADAIIEDLTDNNLIIFDMGEGPS